MVEPNGSFSYDDNFNYIRSRWSEIDQTGTKGYEPRYGELGRLPYSLFVIGLWDAAEPLVLQRLFLNLVSFRLEIASRKARPQSYRARGQVAAEPLDGQLRKADTLSLLAGRVASNRGYCRKTDLVHNFLLRSTRAVEAFLEFICDSDVMNAWTMARVLIERCIWLGYILKTDKVEEFYEYSAFEVKKWAHKAASLGIVDQDSVDDFDEEMEDELGHRLGKPPPQWERLGVEEMCKQAFDMPFSKRIYALYQLASMSTHPGMDDSGEYFKVAAVINTEVGIGDQGPSYEMIQMSAEIFGTLIALAEPPVIEAATEAYGEEQVTMIMQLNRPDLINLAWRTSEPEPRDDTQ